MSIAHFIKDKVIKNSTVLEVHTKPFSTYRKSFKKGDVLTQFGQILNYKVTVYWKDSIDIQLD